MKSEGVVFQELSSMNTTAFFDQYGRRVPSPESRVFSQESRRYFCLNQPAINTGRVYSRLDQYLGISEFVTLDQFRQACGKLWEELLGDPVAKNITHGVYVPFACPPLTDADRSADIRHFVDAAAVSFSEQFPKYAFQTNCPGKPNGDIEIAPGSNYEQFEEARRLGAVVGFYFPNCLSEYDLASQRKQMASLPQTLGRICVLSGIAEAAAAFVSCPDLLFNETSYPHLLTLSALKESDERFFYCFKAYGFNLAFQRRSQMLVPNVTQVSESWAGGLTVFVPV